MNAQKKHKALQGSRSADTRVPSGKNRLPAVQANVGSPIQPDRKTEITPARATETAMVPSARDLAKPAAADTIARRKINPLDSSNPHSIVENALAVRCGVIEREYQNVAPKTVLPESAASFTKQWLLHNHLVWAANDQEFWTALEYLLDGNALEGFCIEAAEQAFTICLASVNNHPDRRAAIYSELASLRQIKKVRDYELKRRAAVVLADQRLLTIHDRIRGAYAGMVGAARVVENVSENRRNAGKRISGYDIHFIDKYNETARELREFEEENGLVWRFAWVPIRWSLTPTIKGNSHRVRRHRRMRPKRPTAGTMVRTSMFLSRQQVADLKQLATLLTSTSAQLVRDFINEGLQRRRQQI